MFTVSRRNSALLCALIFTFILVICADAHAVEDKLNQFTLDNGLRVIVKQDPERKGSDNTTVGSGGEPRTEEKSGGRNQSPHRAHGFQRHEEERRGTNRCGSGVIGRRDQRVHKLG